MWSLRQSKSRIIKEQEAKGLKGNMQFGKKVTFEPLMDFKQNHY